MFMDEDEVMYPLQKIRGLYMNGTLQLNANSLEHSAGLVRMVNTVQHPSNCQRDTNICIEWEEMGKLEYTIRC